MQITVSCPIEPTFRVSQIAGMFDVPLEKKSSQKFVVDDPPLDGDWQIGLIVGPSGSGKSTVAKHLFGDSLYTAGDWPSDKAVVDGFGDLPVKEITKLLTLVGFSSPPSWIKPYHVLSNGERFRCDLARALSLTAISKENTNQVIAFDEFTSVVDRNVAKVASAAISKGIRSGKIGRVSDQMDQRPTEAGCRNERKLETRSSCKLVAVTCHYDVADWLEPDWVLDMASGTVSGRRLRRPEIELRIVRCERRAWYLFAKHHYLSGNLAQGCRCYLALWNDVPVAFCAMIGLLGFKGRWRVSRIVTLPDYQGIGIGSAFMESLAGLYRENGERFSITASHPSIISHCKRSPDWKAVNVMKTGSKGGKHKASLGRAVVSFEYDPKTV